MPQPQRYCPWHFLALAAILWAAVSAAALAKESAASVKDAEQYLAKGDLKAAELELRSAIRESPEDPVLRARLAQIYLQLGDAVAAEREAKAARAHDGNEADYLPVLAEALLGQEKFADLVSSIQMGDREPALESKIRTALGTAAAAMGDREKAGAMLHDAIRLDPSAAEPKIRLAQLLSGTNPAEADKLVDEAIAANPRSAKALQIKGEMLRTRGDEDGAMRLFDEALEIDPKNLPAQLSRAYVKIGQGKFAAADEDLDPILKANPNNFLANYLRALELAKKQQFAAADRIFDNISPAFPRFWAGYYFQGATKLEIGQFAQAEIILRKYLDHFHDDARALRLIALAALRQHAPSRAIDYLKPLVDKSPADAATLSLLGNAYMDAGKPELALQQFEKAAALDPEDATIKTRVAISEIDTGHREEGLSHLEQVYAGHSGAMIAGPTLVVSDLHAGRVEKAAEVASSLVKRDAGNPVYQTLLGEVLATQRDFSGAEAAFRAAVAANTEFPAAVRDLARLYQSIGRMADAEQVYNDVLSKNANDVDALLGLADIYVAEEKWSNAIDTLNLARSAARNDPAAELKLVALYERRRDWENAETLASALAAQFPGDIAVLTAQGRSQSGAGHIDAALSTYKRAYELAPDSPSLLALYVELLREKKYFREAWGVLQQAVARNPGNASLKADLIRVDAEIDGVDGAVLTAEEFARKDPVNSVYDRVAAELYEKAGRAGEGIAHLERALKARAADDDLRLALFRLYRRTGDLVKAEGVLTARLQTDPQDVAARSALAQLYLKTGRPGDAKKVYEDIVSHKPDDVTALLGLADIVAAEGQWSEAMDYISRARAVAPNEAGPGLALVNLYMLRQDWKNAGAAAIELAAKFPGNVDVLEALGRTQIESGDINGAISTYKHTYEIAPDALPILFRYIELLDSAKRYPEAQKVLQDAIRRDPLNASLKADQVRVVAEADGVDAGIAAARDFADNDPSNSVYDIVAAGLYEKAGRGGEAVDLLEKAIIAHPADSNLTVALARLYTRTGAPSKAETVLKARLKADPKAYDVRSALALFYLEQKRDAAAAAEYSGLVEDHPGDPDALNNLAVLYQRQGELKKARELAERAFSMTSHSPSIGDTLGWILLAQGDADRAFTYLKAANLLAPHNPDIQYHLAVALQRVGRGADAQTLLEGLLGSGASFADKAEAEKLLQQLKRG